MSIEVEDEATESIERERHYLEISNLVRPWAQSGVHPAKIGWRLFVAGLSVLEALGVTYETACHGVAKFYGIVSAQKIPSAKA